MPKLTKKMLEAKRRELMMYNYEFAEWLGFKSNAKDRNSALNSQLFQLYRALSGDKRYAAGPRTLRRVAEKMELNHSPATLPAN